MVREDLDRALRTGVLRKEGLEVREPREQPRALPPNPQRPRPDQASCNTGHATSDRRECTP